MGKLTHGVSGTSTAAFINALSEAIGEEQFRIWFGKLKCGIQGSNVLELELPNADYVRWAQRKFGSSLEQAARLAFGNPVSFAWRSADDSLEQAQPAPSVLSSGYTRIPNRWLDELRPRIGLVPWCVFETLLRFVWRGETKLKVLQEHLGRGELVAYVSKPKLAKMLSLSTRRVQSNVRALEQLGLVQTSCQPRGGANVYVLGQNHLGEVLWLADVALKKLRNSEVGR